MNFQSFNPTQISQALQQIAQLRKQQGAAQPDAQAGVSQVQPQQMQLPQAPQADPMKQMGALSQLMGYNQNSLFGYNLGGSGTASAPNNSDLMNTLFGSGQAAGAGAAAQGTNPAYQSIIGAIMSMI